jgi:hypothetical protein
MPAWHIQYHLLQMRIIPGAGHLTTMDLAGSVAAVQARAVAADSRAMQRLTLLQ